MQTANPATPRGRESRWRPRKLRNKKEVSIPRVFDQIHRLALFAGRAGGIRILSGIGLVLLGVSRQSVQHAVVGVPIMLLAVGEFSIGLGLRRLRPWARLGAPILSGIGLLAFPLGTIINAYILYLVLSAKGPAVFLSPEVLSSLLSRRRTSSAGLDNSFDRARDSAVADWLDSSFSLDFTQLVPTIVLSCAETAVLRVDAEQNREERSADFKDLHRFFAGEIMAAV